MTRRPTETGVSGHPSDPACEKRGFPLGTDDRSKLLEGAEPGKASVKRQEPPAIQQRAEPKVPEAALVAPRPVITLLTDFGTRDIYAGVLKGVILGIAPHASVVDLSHEVAPQAIAE